MLTSRPAKGSTKLHVRPVIESQATAEVDADIATSSISAQTYWKRGEGGGQNGFNFLVHSHWMIVEAKFKHIKHGVEGEDQQFR